MTQYTLYGWTRYQCTLEPWIPELESVLTVTRPGFTESADRQIRFVDEERRFYESIPQSIPKFSWGFADIIVDWIAAREDAIKIYPPKGISLGQENLRGNSCLRDARNDEAFDQLPDRVQDFVGMAHKTWMMRLIEPSINKVLHMIAGYALAYPHARIAIGVPNKAEVRMVISGLNRCMQRNPGTRWCRSDPSHHYTRYPQYVVATMGHLPSASLDEYDMLVILDLSHCVGDFTSFNDLVLGRKRLVEPRQLGAITSRAQQGWRRVIVVLPQRPQKGSYDDMMATHVAGTVEWSEQSRLPRTQVHVEWLHARGTQAKKGLDALTQKRDLYWANTRRNRRIAEIARRVAARTKNGLKAFGLSDDAVDRICHAARSGIVIHVESPEHGRELQKILDWPLYHMTTDPNSYEEPFKFGIVTERALKQGWISPGVLFLASGTPFAGIAKYWPAKQSRLAAPVLIDLEDQYDVRAERNASKRCQAYQRLGFHQSENYRPTQQDTMKPSGSSRTAFPTDRLASSL